MDELDKLRAEDQKYMDETLAQANANLEVLRKEVRQHHFWAGRQAPICAGNPPRSIAKVHGRVYSYGLGHDIQRSM
jgi:hypothetical protein